jgi:hypothetical protein
MVAGCRSHVAPCRPAWKGVPRHAWWRGTPNPPPIMAGYNLSSKPSTLTGRPWHRCCSSWRKHRRCRSSYYCSWPRTAQSFCSGGARTCQELSSRARPRSDFPCCTAEAPFSDILSKSSSRRRQAQSPRGTGMPGHGLNKSCWNVVSSPLDTHSLKSVGDLAMVRR